MKAVNTYGAETARLNASSDSSGVVDVEFDRGEANAKATAKIKTDSRCAIWEGIVNKCMNIHLGIWYLKWHVGRVL